MYPSYPCVYKPIPRRSVLARETDVRDASRMRGCEGFLKGPWREQERAGESEREREREREREGKEERETVARSIYGVFPNNSMFPLALWPIFVSPKQKFRCPIGSGSPSFSFDRTRGRLRISDLRT